MVEREIQLGSIFQVVWKRGRNIAMVALTVMVLTALLSLLIHNRYRSEVDLVMTKSKIGERAMMYPAIPMKTYEGLLSSDALLKAVINENGLDKSPFNLEYPRDLKDRMRVRYEEGTARIQVSVELEDPEKAAAVANDVAKKAVKLNRDIILAETKNSRELIDDQLKPIQLQTEIYRQNYEQALVDNKKQLLANKLDTDNTNLAVLRQQKETLFHSLVEQREKLKQYELVFSATDFTPQIDITRTLSSDTVMQGAVKKEKGDLDVNDLGSITFVEQSINEVYQTMRQEYLSLKVNLPGLEAKYESTTSRIAELEQLVNEEQEKLSRMEVSEAEIKRKLDQSLEVLAGIEKNYEWAGTTVASERQDLDIAYPAIPDDKKVYPRRSLIVVLAGMIAFLIMFAYYLVSDLYGLVVTTPGDMDV